MQTGHSSGWFFIDHQCTFELLNPQRSSYLYFPLHNSRGMMSSITPTLHGDAKSGQDAFLMCPVTVEDLHNTRSGHNFWLLIDGVPWSVAGLGAPSSQHTREDQVDQVSMQAGFLWHTLNRSNPDNGLFVCITNFVPAGDEAQIDIILDHLPQVPD
ncbi:MAG: hypothetical protein CVU41_16200 [Chloroflexi bacterium HGW-Chloroflexi-3]|nr:MAG: hypothetical protein CVU41_16200 [Chloroflexi bacterium HGW-Chloroflexi-3]